MNTTLLSSLLLTATIGASVALSWTSGVAPVSIAEGAAVSVPGATPASDTAAIPAADAALPAPPAAPAPIIDVAICLDVSGSMGGLIEAARERIWSIVSDLASAEPVPDLRLALITFGHSNYEEDQGWVRLDCNLTDDLDLVSQQLFALTIAGGCEYVSRAVHVATNELAWREGDNPLRVILVAGNESAAQDPMISVEEACSGAAGKSIQINAFFCGPEAHGDAAGWASVARLADGYFASIDHTVRVVVQPTPFDEELAALNTRINTTYLAFGASGAAGHRRQTAQDANAESAPGGSGVGIAERVAAKASAAYRNSAWDLVDAVRLETVVLSELEAEQLPEEMRSMTLEERALHVERLMAERTAVQERIRELSALRQADLVRQRAAHSAGGPSTFGRQVRDALRAQAAAKGLRFPEDAETPEAESPSDPEKAANPDQASKSSCPASPAPALPPAPHGNR